MNIREANNNDKSKILEFASILYRTPESELNDEIEQLLQSDKNIFFVAEDQEVIGFINGSIRTDYVEGSSSSPTGYIEGIYIKEEYRKKGLAKKLVDQVAKWSKQKGCTELASDVEDFNQTSIDFHNAIGLKEVNRLVCFIKKI